MTSSKIRPETVQELVATIEAWQEIVRSRGGRAYARIETQEPTPEEKSAMESRTTGPLPIERKH